MMPIMNLVMNGVSLVVVWIAAVSASNVADVGNMMAFMQYALQIIMSFMMISLVFVIMPRASGLRRPHRGDHRQPGGDPGSGPSPSSGGKCPLHHPV